MISKETSRAEHEYMNKHPPPPINVLATAVTAMANFPAVNIGQSRACKQPKVSMENMSIKANKKGFL